MIKQSRSNRKGRIQALLLSGVLTVATCVTASVTLQAAETGNTKLQNPRVEMNYCDTVYFGSYWQEDTNGDRTVDQTDKKQPIQWRILSKNGNDAYVIADKVLDWAKYNEEDTDVTWETCTLRKWLNNDFYNTAFSTDEKGAIIEQTLKNEDNEEYGIAGGNVTTDKVYLPALSDMKNPKYGFSEDYSFHDQTRIGKATSYAKKQGVSTSGERSSWWWLRSPGVSAGDAADVFSDGTVTVYGAHVGSLTGGVRPVLHLNLSSPLVKKGEPLEVSLKSTEWDIVELGTYEGRKIRWRVLSVNGNDVFLLSDQILTNKKYNEECKEITWADCTLRTWLNGDFYSGAFTDAEKKGIVETTYKNENNPWWPTKGGVDTEDRVTLLSIADILKKEYGFPTSYHCQHPSRIACGKEGYDQDGYGSGWWLRSPASSSFDAADVCGNGMHDSFGTEVSYTKVGVRPALHFNLSVYPITKKGTFMAEDGVKLVNLDEPGGNSTSGNTNTPIKLDDKKDTGNTTEKSNGGQSATTETKNVQKDNPTTFNIKNKQTYKTSKKVQIKDKDGIKQIKLNSKTIKVKNKKSYSFKLSKYKKNLKKTGKWNKLVVTDKNGKKKTIKFKTK